MFLIPFLFLFFTPFSLGLLKQDPKTQLTYDNVLLNIEKPFDSDRLLLRRVHAFLERHGFINFGIFKRLEDIVPSKVPVRVIVIGAGISVSRTIIKLSVQAEQCFTSEGTGSRTTVATIWNGRDCSGG